MVLQGPEPDAQGLKFLKTFHGRSRKILLEVKLKSKKEEKPAAASTKDVTTWREVVLGIELRPFIHSISLMYF